MVASIWSPSGVTANTVPHGARMTASMLSMGVAPKPLTQDRLVQGYAYVDHITRGETRPALS